MSPSKKSLKIQIKGLDWTVFGQSNKSYARAHGSDSAAITDINEREIYFNLDHFTTSYCRHEIFHAFLASSGTSSSSLTADQVEELAAETYGDHGPVMDMLTDQIVNFLFKKEKK